MGAVPEFDRARVLAYRSAAQQLDRPGGPPADLAVLDLGVQDTPYGSARQALAARSAEPPRDGDLPLVWAARGAPHLHRWEDLNRLAAALWPLDDTDAAYRVASGQTEDIGALGLAAFTGTARAFREVVTGPMTKGEVSTGVSARVPAAATYDCRSCAARHISTSLFQQAGLAGGVRVEGGGRTTRIVPLDDPPPIPETARHTTDLVRAYLRLHGPATPGHAAKFLNIKPAVVTAVWPDATIEVRVDGTRRHLPEDLVEALATAPEPRMVRLLPPGDPYLQSRDRDLLVPDRARQKEVWRILGNPGALYVDGEVAGTWRARKRGNTLDVTVAPFEPPSTRVRRAAAAEAEHLAAARDLGAATVAFDDSGTPPA